MKTLRETLRRWIELLTHKEARRVTAMLACTLVCSALAIYQLIALVLESAPAKPAVTRAVALVPPRPASASPEAAAAPARAGSWESAVRAAARPVAAAPAPNAAPAKAAVAQAAALVPARPVAAAPKAAPAKSAVTEAMDRARALFNEGKYAQAKEVLDRFIAAAPAGTKSWEIQEAQILLDRVHGVLLVQYQAIQTAEQRLAATESERAQQREARQAREQKMLADADRFCQQAQDGCDSERNYQEAKRLYAQVASDRALDAFNTAMENYNAGRYDAAQKVLEHLSQFIGEQRADDPQFKSGLGADRERRIAECLKKLPDARDNLAQGALLAKGPVASRR